MIFESDSHSKRIAYSWLSVSILPTTGRQKFLRLLHLSFARRPCTTPSTSEGMDPLGSEVPEAQAPAPGAHAKAKAGAKAKAKTVSRKK